MNLPDKPTPRAVEIAGLIWKQKDTSVFTIARIIDAEAVQEIVRLQEMQNKRLNDYGINAGSMLRKELRSVIRRYGQESDVTVYQLIGCLEVVKQDVMDMMDKQCDVVVTPTVESFRILLQEIYRVASGETQVAADDTEGMDWIAKRILPFLMESGFRYECLCQKCGKQFELPSRDSQHICPACQ